MNQTFSLISLYNDPFDSGRDAISRIVIPRMQRPYAHGRKDRDSSEVREAFLGKLFSFLSGTEPLFDLDFIYGKTERDKNGKWTLQILDGQQRITTLFLLHWYLFVREKSNIEPEGIDSFEQVFAGFAYETRYTSETFCGKILSEYGRHLSFSNAKPSDVICALLDYVSDFKMDPTIGAMLVMLDAMHSHYEKIFPGGKCGELWRRLSLIRFRFVSLTEYKLSEDLYIKMNARGLKLTPFESFKADFLGLMDLPLVANSTHRKVDPSTGQDVAPDNPDSVSFKSYFGTKLDAVWCDLFWDDAHPEKYDLSYMRFFSRFFAVRFVLGNQGKISGKDWNQDVTLRFFLPLPKNQADEGRYRGDAEPFIPLTTDIWDGKTCFDDIASFLNIFRLKKQDIFDAMKPLWESENWVQADWFCDGETPFTQTTLVKMAAVTEFARLFRSFPVDIFRIWMKCVNCIVENTDINDKESMAVAAGNIAKLIRMIARRVPGDVKAFVRAMADIPQNEFGSTPIREEIEKANRIFNSGSEAEANHWVEIFDDIARNQFLKGMIGFYYSRDISVDDFDVHATLIRSLFGDDGIAKTYRDDHHWILRAILSQLTEKSSFEGQGGQPILENNTSKKYLKNLISSLKNPRLQERMHDLFAVRLKGLKAGTDDKASQSVIDAFRCAVDEAPPVSNEETWDFRETIRVLRDDVAFYRWVFDREGTVKLYWNYNNYQYQARYNWDCLMVPLLRPMKKFAQEAEMTPVATTDKRNGYSEEYGMFIGQQCAMEKKMTNFPNAVVQVRFYSSQYKYYAVEISVLLPPEEEKVLGKTIPGPTRPESEGTRHLLQENPWNFSEDAGGENCITPSDLREEVDKIVSMLPAPSATNAAPAMVASQEAPQP